MQAAFSAICMRAHARFLLSGVWEGVYVWRVHTYARAHARACVLCVCAICVQARKLLVRCVGVLG